MEEVKKSIYKNLGLKPETIFAKKWGCNPAITLDKLLTVLLPNTSSPKAMAVFGRSQKTFITNIKKLFPDVSLNGGRETWAHWFIKQSDYKYCNTCFSFKLKDEFGMDNYTYDRFHRKCNSCRKISNADWYNKNTEYHENYLINNRASFNANNAKRRALILQRTVKWANLEEIKEFYKNCPKGYHVDHYYPLQGKIVCGLHVLENLQYITAEENMSKSNKMPT